ncbi:MAG TPA: lamin tail domain-containing protein [Chitinophagales bacterium]|nr:lamin tail domain-containing protein [Chitinophagales bacterium]
MKQFYKTFYYSFLLLLMALQLRSQSITFSELNYNSDSTTNSGNWVELYNYGSSQLDISNWVLKDADDLHTFTFPATTILMPGGRLAVTDDMVKFNAQHPLVFNYIGNLSFSFGNSGDQVRLFNNSGLLKVFMQYADSTPWPSAADGTGRTLELLDENQSPDSASNWFVGCMGGSPGTAFAPCDDPIVFGEINYNSDTLADAGDWVELWNHSTGSINLTGWSFKDSHDDNIYYIPANTQLASDGRLVLVHDTALFFSRHPNVTNWAGPLSFNLSNGGELIRLFDYMGKLKFSVVYNDHGTWPPGANGDGYTLELLDAIGNMNTGTDWFTGCPEGSPGTAYDPDCNVGIGNVSDQQLTIFNDATGRSIVIEVPDNDFYAGEKISVFNLIGEEVFSSVMNTNPFLLNTSKLAPGMYLVKLSNGKNYLTNKFIVP